MIGENHKPLMLWFCASFRHLALLIDALHDSFYSKSFRDPISMKMLNPHPLQTANYDIMGRAGRRYAGIASKRGGIRTELYLRADDLLNLEVDI